MNFSVLGCGRWGSFIAWYLDKNKNNVTVWGRKHDDIVNELFTTRKNEYVAFPESIELTHDLEYALNKSEYIVISIGAQAVRDLMSNVCKTGNIYHIKSRVCHGFTKHRTGSVIKHSINFFIC